MIWIISLPLVAFAVHVCTDATELHIMHNVRDINYQTLKSIAAVQ